VQNQNIDVFVVVFVRFSTILKPWKINAAFLSHKHQPGVNFTHFFKLKRIYFLPIKIDYKNYTGNVTLNMLFVH